MARNYQIFIRIIIIVFIWLLFMLLMNVFNNGNSYYYINTEKRQQEKQQQMQHSQQFKELWPNQTYLKLDYKTREPLTFELITEMEKKIPSLPLEYFYRHSNKVMEKFKNCARYPAIQVLNFYNTYWQTLYIDNSIFHLYGAYYDARPQTTPVIRVLAMTNHQHRKLPIVYCQLWFEDDSRPILTTVKEFKMIWNENWGIKSNVYYPYLMTCDIPKHTNITGDPIPKVINLVGYQCDTASNSLRIIYNKPAANEKKQEFAVCVKGLDFPYEDLSARLVEWLELLRILGVHKVFMHRLQVHENVNRILDYYQEQGFVEVQNVTLVGGVVGQPRLQHWLMKSYLLNRRLNELIPYNACFYSNMYKYEFIALMDIDEIIMPKGNLKTWQHLVTQIQSLKNESKCALCAANVYFPGKLPYQQVPVDNNPSYMYMLNHVYRFQDYTSKHYHVKCLHNTQQVLTLHNHYPLSYLNASCAALDLSTTYAQLQHYRDVSGQQEEINKVHQIIRDENLKRYRKPLMERCTKVLKDLHFIN